MTEAAGFFELKAWAVFASALAASGVTVVDDGLRPSLSRLPFGLYARLIQFVRFDELRRERRAALSTAAVAGGLGPARRPRRRSVGVRQ